MTNLSTDSAYLIYFHVTSKFRNVAMFVIFDVEIIFYNILCVRLWFVSIPNLTRVLASSCLSVCLTTCNSYPVALWVPIYCILSGMSLDLFLFLIQPNNK